MIYGFFSIFLLFFVYSVIGYIVEVLFVSQIEGKITLSRGFLIGPYLPIYGIGALIMTYLLSSYKNDVLVLFVMSTVLCSILEYLTSLIMEKIFKLRWWDYSDKSFNINGRICLSNGILFGFGGVLVVEFINPLFEKALYSLPRWLIIMLGIIFVTVFLTDLIITVYIMTNLKINVNKYTNKDATKMIREEIQGVIKKHMNLTTRLLKAFPNIESLNNKEFSSFRELIFNTKMEMKRIKLEYKKNKKRAKNKLKNSTDKLTK